jgi:hypothetical protein
MYKERINAYRHFDEENPERPFGRPTPNWEDTITMAFQDTGLESVDLIDLAQDRDRWRVLVKAVMNLRVP